MKNLVPNLAAAAVLVVSATAFAPLASAAPIELNAGGAPTVGFGPGDGRALGIRADTDFSLTSLGFFGDLESETWEAVLYSSTNGSDTTGVLASSSAVVGGGGLGWYDIGLTHSLTAGSFYVVHWLPQDGSFSLGAAGYHFFPDSTLPVSVGGGALTVLDGAEGGSGGLSFGNSVHARMRVNGITSVPEPAIASLLALGVLGIFFGTRRRARA